MPHATIRPLSSEAGGASKRMNPIDIALVALLAIPALLGMWKGLANVVTVLVGIWASFLLAPLVKRALAPSLEGMVGDVGLAAVLAYGAGFVGVLLLVGLAGWLVTRSLKKLDLQWANRFAGLALGALCGVLIGGVLVATVEAVLPEAPMLEESVLAGPLGSATRFLVALGPVEDPAAEGPEPAALPPVPPSEALGQAAEPEPSEPAAPPD